jgi:hypothetical protein
MDLDAGSQYSFPFWQKYVEDCRNLAALLSVPMRVLDRALWQYSRQAGGPGTAA